MEGLTPGRMVHYVMKGQANIRPAAAGDPTALQHRAAVVTHLHENDPSNAVDLCVFSRGKPDGFGGMSPTFAVHMVPYDESGNEPDRWHWIERA